MSIFRKSRTISELLDQHVEMVSSNELVVYITKPFKLEEHIRPIGWRDNNGIAKMYKGELLLTPYGDYLASQALSILSRKAKLFWAHKSELKDFLAEYHDSRAKLETEIAESRRITNEYREKADWNKTAESFKSLRLLLERQSSLYGKMFSERFGENEGFLYEEEIEEYYKKIIENNSGD